MKSFIKYMFLLIAGGEIYYFIEIIARGYSHWTMFLTGGICFIVIGLLNEITPKMPLIQQMLLSMFIITVIELIAGCIVNIWLGWNVWDYSDRVFNIWGQICLKNSIYWFGLSLPAIILDDHLRYWFFKDNKPHYKLI